MYDVIMSQALEVVLVQENVACNAKAHTLTLRVVSLSRTHNSFLAHCGLGVGGVLQVSGLELMADSGAWTVVHSEEYWPADGSS